MAINILTGWKPPVLMAGGIGINVWRVACQFNANDTNGTLASCPFKHVSNVYVDPIGNNLTTAATTISTVMGSVNATTALTVIAPKTGVISFVRFVDSQAITNSDSTYYTFGLVDKTSSKTLIDSAKAPNTTKATGGGTVGAYTPILLVNSTVSADLAITALDVLEFTITKNSTPAGMNECALLVGITSTQAGAERVAVDNAYNSNGIIDLSSTPLSISRTGDVLTSGLQFSLVVEGTLA